MKRLLLIALIFTAACGSDDGAEPNNDQNTDVRMNNNTSPNNVANNANNVNNANNGNNANNTSNNVNNANNTSNNANNVNNVNNSANNGTNNGNPNNTVIWRETEPNDDRQAANEVFLGDTLKGSAEAGGQDVFKFDGVAGMILDVEIVEVEPTVDVVLEVEPENGDVEDRAVDLLTGRKRQFFLPETKTWYITIRNLEANDRDYEIALREVTPTPITETFAATVAGDMNDGAVDVYALPMASGRVETVLEAERLQSGSDLDSVLFVYSPNAGLVDLNDDAPATTDSEVDFTAAAGETYWLVVDAWRVGPDSPYELSVTLP